MFSLKFGVVLSGCGVRDGSEIHEAALALLALDKLNIEPIAFAPDILQSSVVDHFSGARDPAPRRVLSESARIARGRISPLSAFNPDALDGLLFPGGSGAAVNLSDFAKRGAAMSVLPEVKKAIEAMHHARRPQGFICIAPALAACVLGKFHPRLTIGTDRETALALESMGARHVSAPADGIVVDEENRIVSTPAYMLATRISEVSSGIEKLAASMAALAGTR